MSLDILNATLERGKLSEEEAQICREVIAEKQNTPSPEQAANGNSTENPDYGVSIAVAKLVSFIGWLAVIAGMGLSIWLVSEGNMALLGVPSAIGVALMGLLLVIGGQVSRAVMDNANYARQMLDKMK